MCYKYRERSYFWIRVHLGPLDSEFQDLISNYFEEFIINEYIEYIWALYIYAIITY